MSDILETLKSIADIGVVEIKPFLTWDGSPFKDQIWSIWLLNVGQIQQVHEEGDRYQGALSRTHSIKLEILARSVVAVNGCPVVTDEDLKSFNDKNQTNFTALQYKKMHLSDLDELVLGRFDVVYGELLDRQARRVQGLVKCHNCGDTFPVGDKSRIARLSQYTTAEVVCTNCETPQVSSVETNSDTTSTVPTVYRCNYCGLPVDSRKELDDHIESCYLRPDKDV